MERRFNSLVLKSNRSLGARLVESKLVELDAIEAANVLFTKTLRENGPRSASILRILCFETQKLDESKVLQSILADDEVGAVFLENYAIEDSLLKGVEVGECMATRTLPFDYDEGVWFLATAYYLSNFVREYWEAKLEGKIIWYVATFLDIEGVLEQMNQAAQKDDTDNGGQKE